MRCFRWLAILVLLVLISLPTSVASVWASTVPTANQREIVEVIVSGKPPKYIAAAAASVPDVHIQGVTNVLSDVPAFDWSYGCSATSAAMLFGYYDRTGYSNMYIGPANGGVCPLDNSIWGYGESPLSATHQGVDERTTRGHVDDYWISYLDYGPDPYIVNGWTEHTADCTADFMGTSQSKFGLPDGATAFYWYENGDPLYDYAWGNPPDGCHGMRLFAESRGYTVTADFSQFIKGQGTDPTKGFTFADFMAEIDAGRPVLIQVESHTMLGYGYDNTSGNIVYVHDTWDYSNHTMTWGGTYSSLNLQHLGVTVLRLSGSPLPPPPPTSAITVSSPNNGSESWPVGTYQNITWSYTGNPGTYVKIELLKGGAVNRVITSSASIGSGGSGSYSWLVPSTQTGGNDYQVRITSTTNADITDTSGNFTITGPTITGVSPNGGESWPAGTYQNITWSYTGNPGTYVKIELLKGGVVNRVITSSRSIGSGGSGSYSWLVPSTQTGGNDYRVRITSTTNAAITDTSDNYFTITGPPSPTIRVTSPNDVGVSWPAGTSQNITWSYTGNPGTYVKIELLKGGVVNRVITSSRSIGSGGSGSYSWTIPSTQTLGSDYRVKITSTSNSAIADTSDNNFAITPPPPAGLTVTSPNGGQIWRAGTYQTITWTYTGNPGAYVKIELLKGGVVNRVITSSRSIGSGGSGSYSWLISTYQTAGIDYKVRITSSSNATPTDTSDANFSISR